MPTTIIKQTQVENAINSATQTALNTKVNKITSVDNQAVRFDGVTGEVQGSGVTILDNGNVGIGTTTPTSLLTLGANGGILLNYGGSLDATRPSIVVGDNAPRYEIRGTLGNGFADAGFLRLRAGGGSDASAASFIDISGYSGDINLNNNITFNTINTERVRIDLSGNVGIGTSTPAHALDVRSGNVYAHNGSFLLSGYAGTSNSQYFGKEYLGGIIAGMEIENTTLGGNYSQKLHFRTHRFGVFEGRAMTIGESGNVGIGTTTPTSRLQVVGLPSYANNAAAISAGLTAGAFFHNGDGILRVVF